MYIYIHTLRLLLKNFLPSELFKHAGVRLHELERLLLHRGALRRAAFNRGRELRPGRFQLGQHVAHLAIDEDVAHEVIARAIALRFLEHGDDAVVLEHFKAQLGEPLSERLRLLPKLLRALQLGHRGRGQLQWLLLRHWLFGFCAARPRRAACAQIVHVGGESVPKVRARKIAMVRRQAGNGVMSAFIIGGALALLVLLQASSFEGQMDSMTTDPLLLEEPLPLVLPETPTPSPLANITLQPSVAATAAPTVKFELRTLESRNWARALELARAEGYSIQGFYHVSTWKPYWPHVIDEQLRILDGMRYLDGDLDVQYAPDFSGTWTPPVFASPLQAASSLFINIASGDAGDFARVKAHVLNVGITNSSKAKIRFGFNYTVDRQSFDGFPEQRKAEMFGAATHSEGEVSTVLAMQAFCQRERAAGRKTIVFYVHSKGVCCYPRASHNSAERAPAAWRDMMMASVFETPSICLRALLMGYPLCGSHKGDGNNNGWFAGNFWWGVCGACLGARQRD